MPAGGFARAWSPRNRSASPAWPGIAIFCVARRTGGGQALEVLVGGRALDAAFFTESQYLLQFHGCGLGVGQPSAQLGGVLFAQVRQPSCLAIMFPKL